MDEIAQQRIAQIAWLEDALRETELDPTNFARAAKVTPSTLTRFMKPEWPGLLNSATWAKLQSAKRRIIEERKASIGGDAEVRTNAVHQPENDKLLKIWARIDDDLKISLLHILEAITDPSSRKVG